MNLDKFSLSIDSGQKITSLTDPSPMLTCQFKSLAPCSGKTRKVEGPTSHLLFPYFDS